MKGPPAPETLAVVAGGPEKAGMGGCGCPAPPQFKGPSPPPARPAARTARVSRAARAGGENGLRNLIPDLSGRPATTARVSGAGGPFMGLLAAHPIVLVACKGFASGLRPPLHCTARDGILRLSGRRASLRWFDLASGGSNSGLGLSWCQTRCRDAIIGGASSPSPHFKVLCSTRRRRGRRRGTSSVPTPPAPHRAQESARAAQRLAKPLRGASTMGCLSKGTPRTGRPFPRLSRSLREAL